MVIDNTNKAGGGVQVKSKAQVGELSITAVQVLLFNVGLFFSFQLLCQTIES